MSIILNGTDSQQNELILNEQVGFYCAVQRGRPEPNIYWSLVDSNSDMSPSSVSLKRLGGELKHGNMSFHINSTRIESPDSYFYFSWLQMNTSLMLANKSLVCVVEHQLLREPLMKVLRLNLKCKCPFSSFHKI